MRRKETPDPIWIKVRSMADIPDAITFANFGDDQLRGFWSGGGVRFCPSPLTLIVVLSQIPLRYPASEPANELVQELVCDLLASWSQIC